MGEIDKNKSIEEQAITVFKNERIEDITAIIFAGIFIALVFLGWIK